MFRTAADRLAERDRLPTSARAVLGYYADTGVFDYASLRLQRRVEATTEAMVADAFGAVESALATEFGHEFVDFSYDTKLVLPAELTLGYLYRHAEDDRRAEDVTRLAIEALIDGDMRDAINDDEFEDFEVDFPVDDGSRREVARIAQATLQERVDRYFEDYPRTVREAYEWAVAISETHQDEDDHFRSLMAAAQRGDEAARDAVRDEYKFAAFDDPPVVFDADELDLPYLKTQYDRVGVIYDGMIEMYREAGVPVEDAFKKSIVLAIIGAQIWLDDVDDYRDDSRDGQLTPVTAEYLLADDDAAAADTVVNISERYLDLAKDHATAVDSTLTGIGAEYILRSGRPGVLPRT
jgi:hypothetical protein